VLNFYTALKGERGYILVELVEMVELVELMKFLKV